MSQTCKFHIKPTAIANGGYIKGKYIVWLNLCVKEILPEEGSAERYESDTDRLVLDECTIESFLKEADFTYLSQAQNWEIEAILRWFDMDNDISAWIQIRKAQIEGYDKSDKVNRFFISGRPLWLDKATRVGLVNSISAEKRNGIDTTSLWFDNMSIQLPVDDALAKLDQVELYAKECFNVTARHIAEIEQMTTIQELRAYDITAGYPEFLNINITE